MTADRVPREAAARPAGGADGRIELKWDNGQPMWLKTWNTGAGAWVGNDFDISTLSGSWWIEQIRVMSGASWPNGQWDGFRLGVYAFAGSLPGSLIHGPRYVRGAGSGFNWCDFDFGMWEWSLLGHDTFVVAVEQYYNYPSCDPYTMDGNTTFLRHSWQYYGGIWEPLVGTYGYRNLMVRVVISDLMAVAPASLGRVKALFR
jgi:hypothetical protein